MYDADVPENLLKNATSVEGHFNLVNHQLLQVRSALALAQKLGRVLVMPKLYCGFDRWWAPHEGEDSGLSDDPAVLVSDGSRVRGGIMASAPA